MDPNKIRFGRRFKSVRDLLDLNFSVGHAVSVPSLDEMTAIVETMLVNGPMARVTLRSLLDDTVTVCTGQKLVAALAAFAAGARLGRTVFLPEWSGKSLAELPNSVQRRFYRRDVDVLEIEVGTPDDVAGAVVAALQASV